MTLHSPLLLHILSWRILSISPRPAFVHSFEQYFFHEITRWTQYSEGINRMLAGYTELQVTSNITNALITLLQLRMKGHQSVFRTSSELLWTQACQLHHPYFLSTAQTPPATLPHWIGRTLRLHRRLLSLNSQLWFGIPRLIPNWTVYLTLNLSFPSGCKPTFCSKDQCGHCPVPILGTWPFACGLRLSSCPGGYTLCQAHSLALFHPLS